jgi:hypothetical protein
MKLGKNSFFLYLEYKIRSNFAQRSSYDAKYWGVIKSYAQQETNCHFSIYE